MIHHFVRLLKVNKYLNHRLTYVYAHTYKLDYNNYKTLLIFFIERI